MIYFQSIRWRNFLSTGNEWTEVQLNRSNTTLIVGENGAGKSTLLDALSFVLYGKPYRNINKPLLVNSINGKNCIVEIMFKVGNKRYFIRRGIKPARFEIYLNDKMIDQSSNIKDYQEQLERNILHLNHKSFTQIVVIGSANFTPFMQLKPNDRRLIIEDLLDIEIFSKMFSVLKDRMSDNKESLISLKHSVEVLEEKIQLTHKHINQINALKMSDRKAKEDKIEEYKKQIDICNEDMKQITEQITELNGRIAEYNNVDKNLSELKNIEYDLNGKLKRFNSEIHFFDSNHECPTCEQPIDQEFKTKSIEDRSIKVEEIESALTKMETHYTSINKKIEEKSVLQNRINDLNQKMFELNTNIRMINESSESLRVELQKEIPEDETSIEELKQLNVKCSETKTLYDNQLLLREDYDVASSLLKDGGIKAKIIKQYIPIINRLMNKYLAAMEFFVQFELDENFNEKIRSMFRDEFSYDSFSEGEKMRIDLSLLFTWRSVAKLRNSVSTNLLLMDEVFDSSLDNTGTEEFLKIISQLSTDTNVFVISHKGDQLFDKFSNIIRFEKTKNFSKMVA